MLQDLNRMDWTNKWLLTFNADKCKVMRVGQFPNSILYAEYCLKRVKKEIWEYVSLIT